MKYLKSSEIARAAGIHTNTLRLYEEWELLPPVSNPKGQRKAPETLRSDEDACYATGIWILRLNELEITGHEINTVVNEKVINSKL